jgi:hypothetical protein
MLEAMDTAEREGLEGEAKLERAFLLKTAGFSERTENTRRQRKAARPNGRMALTAAKGDIGWAS